MARHRIWSESLAIPSMALHFPHKRPRTHLPQVNSESQHPWSWSIWISVRDVKRFSHIAHLLSHWSINFCRSLNDNLYLDRKKDSWVDRCLIIFRHSSEQYFPLPLARTNKLPHSAHGVGSRIARRCCFLQVDIARSLQFGEQNFWLEARAKNLFLQCAQVRSTNKCVYGAALRIAWTVSDFSCLACQQVEHNSTRRPDG